MSDHEPKFTRGPWHVDGPASNQIVWAGENRVCFLAHSDGHDDERDLATGHLIAASPDLFDVAKAYEAWEADVILNADWGSDGMHDLPTLTQAQWDRLIEIQTMRNAALTKVSHPHTFTMRVAMSNMSVEDLLDELGGYGAVTLRKGLFSGAGSPHLRGRPERWSIEITLPGYTSKYAMSSRIEVSGSSIRDVVDAAYDALEMYIFSAKAAEDRQKYESDHRFYEERYDKATSYQRHGFDPIRHPGELIPPIVWGQRRGGLIGIVTTHNLEERR